MSHYALEARHTDPRRLRRERDRAREIKASGWWKSKIAVGRCEYCSRSVGAANLTLDHRVPLARGGESTRQNCVPACAECNASKRLHTPVDLVFEQLARERGFDEEGGPSVTSETGEILPSSISIPNEP